MEINYGIIWAVGVNHARVIKEMIRCPMKFGSGSEKSWPVFEAVPEAYTILGPVNSKRLFSSASLRIIESSAFPDAVQIHKGLFINGFTLTPTLTHTHTRPLQSVYRVVVLLQWRDTVEWRNRSKVLRLTRTRSVSPALGLSETTSAMPSLSFMYSLLPPSTSLSIYVFLIWLIHEMLCSVFRRKVRRTLCWRQWGKRSARRWLSLRYSKSVLSLTW